MKTAIDDYLTINHPGVAEYPANVAMFDFSKDSVKKHRAVLRRILKKGPDGPSESKIMRIDYLLSPGFIEGFGELSNDGDTETIRQLTGMISRGYFGKEKNFFLRIHRGVTLFESKREARMGEEGRVVYLAMTNSEYVDLSKSDIKDYKEALGLQDIVLLTYEKR